MSTTHQHGDRMASFRFRVGVLEGSQHMPEKRTKDSVKGGTKARARDAAVAAQRPTDDPGVG